jgi:hypothetical protein
MGTGNSQPAHHHRPSPAAGAFTRRLTILTPAIAVHSSQSVSVLKIQSTAITANQPQSFRNWVE